MKLDFDIQVRIRKSEDKEKIQVRISEDKEKIQQGVCLHYFPISSYPAVEIIHIF